MAEPKVFYVRMKLTLWENGLEFPLNPNIPVTVHADSVGYLEVFDSLEKFRKVYPDDDYSVIRTWS